MRSPIEPQQDLGQRGHQAGARGGPPVPLPASGEGHCRRGGAHLRLRREERGCHALTPVAQRLKIYENWWSMFLSNFAISPYIKYYLKTSSHFSYLRACLSIDFFSLPIFNKNDSFIVYFIYYL